MSFTALDMQLSDFRDAACAEIYGGSGYSSLSVTEQAVVDRLVLRGQRSFWLHPPIDPPHVWSCLRVTGTMTLWADIAVASTLTATGVFGSVTTITANSSVFFSNMVNYYITVTTVGTFQIASYISATQVTVGGSHAWSGSKTFSVTGDGIYYLPSDFESQDCDRLVWMENLWVPEPMLMDTDRVNLLRSMDDSIGYPQYAAVRWQEADGTERHQKELIVYPRCSGDYDVSFPYKLQPTGMSDANPYPLGGPEFHDVLLSAILAICEEERDGRRGDRYAEYAEKCRRAAQRDRSRHHNFRMGQLNPDSGFRNPVFDVKRMIGTATGA